MFFIMLLVISSGIIALYLVSYLFSPKRFNLKGAHVLVTGGSSGIGKCVAAEVVRRGASVSLLARNKAKLQDAKDFVEKNIIDKENQKVICVSADVSADYETVEKAVQQAEKELGPVDVLINSAGFASNGKFEDIPIKDFQKVMDVNYIGSVFATRAVIGHMKERQRGRITFLSSQGGQLGVYGFTAYSPTKFALRGLAESLQMEVSPYNIRVTLSFPPDTDTPGFQNELTDKPKETILISETSGLYEPDYVAKLLVNDIVKGKFTSWVGLDGYMLNSLTCGMSPPVFLTEAIQQVLTMSIFRAISLFYLWSFDKIVQRCKTEREKTNKRD